MKNDTSIGLLILISLTLMLAGMKIGGLIEWSWLAVSTPLWFPIVFLVIAVLSIEIKRKNKGKGERR